MKVEIKNSVIFLDDETEDYSMLVEFNMIIQALTKADKIQSIDNVIKANLMRRPRHFHISYTLSKAYVHQILDDDIDFTEIIIAN